MGHNRTELMNSILETNVRQEISQKKLFKDQLKCYLNCKYVLPWTLYAMVFFMTFSTWDNLKPLVLNFINFSIRLFLIYYTNYEGMEIITNKFIVQSNDKILLSL